MHLMQLRSLADADLAALLAAVEGMPVAEVRNVLIAAVPELMGPYVTASGELAAVLFEDLRAEAGRRGTFYAEVAAPLPSAQKIETTARWAVSPLADDNLRSTTFTRMSGALSSMVMGASSDTMRANGTREMVGFQRMPRPGCCAFCGMLASRGADYSDEAAAGGKVTYRSGGKSWTGTASHDYCHCVVMPVYSGSEMADLAEKTEAQYTKLYTAATSSDLSDGSVKGILSAWRTLHGSH